MSRWLALYLNLVGHPPLTDGDTSRHTDARANGRPHAEPFAVARLSRCVTVCQWG